MRRRANLIAGVVCGAVCVAGILSYSADLRADVEAQRAEALARYGGEQVEVLVATSDIAVGETLDATNSEKRLWLGELVPDDAVVDSQDVAALPATSPIYAGEVVLERRFDEHESVALQVPDGKCAVSVPAKAVSAVGGSVGPGSYVDVYAASGASTDLLASRVLVLSTSTTSDEKDSGKDADVTWVALAVEPDQVAEVITAAQKSELYFTLPAEGSGDVQAGVGSIMQDDRSSADGIVESDDAQGRLEGDALGDSSDGDAEESADAAGAASGRASDDEEGGSSGDGLGAAGSSTADAAFSYQVGDVSGVRGER